MLNLCLFIPSHGKLFSDEKRSPTEKKKIRKNLKKPCSRANCMRLLEDKQPPQEVQDEFPTTWKYCSVGRHQIPYTVHGRHGYGGKVLCRVRVSTWPCPDPAELFAWCKPMSLSHFQPRPQRVGSGPEFHEVPICLRIRHKKAACQLTSTFAVSREEFQGTSPVRTRAHAVWLVLSSL